MLPTKPGFVKVCEELDRRQQITLGFERISALLDALGNPERGLRVLQVVGTNGKGTTTVALAAALEELGASAGAYLSPHVLSYTERVMLHGQYVTEDQFAAGMSAAITAADENAIDASQFELLTAGALAMFRDAGLDIAVLEAGLGARHDATTAAEPEVVVLTNVSIDHAEYLGDTVEAIAREKLASLRAGSRLILGDPYLLDIAQQECDRIGATLVEAYNHDSGNEAIQGFAPYALQNARLGIFAAEAVMERSLSTEVPVLESLRNLLPGRFEVREVRGVTVVVDGGHNPGGVRAAVAGIESLYGERPLVVVFGALRGKDIARMLDALVWRADALVLTKVDNERAIEPESLWSEHETTNFGGSCVRVEEDAELALSWSVEEARVRGGLVLVTGSLYLGARLLGGLREK